MTYGCVLRPNQVHTAASAAVSHSAELVRGNFLVRTRRPPHPPLRATLPQGEKGRRGFCRRNQEGKGSA